MNAIKNILQNPWIIFTELFGKIWIFPCVPFRAWARNYVYNYVLQNGKREWLTRLWERHPTDTHSNGPGWILKDIHGTGREGFVKWRRVNKTVFYLTVLFVWGWLDDDSNEDTTDKGHILRTLDGAYPWEIGRFLKPELSKIDWTDVIYGNTFDLGDIREVYEFNNWAATATWNWRNTAMNFQYLFLNY